MIKDKTEYDAVHDIIVPFFGETKWRSWLTKGMVDTRILVGKIQDGFYLQVLYNRYRREFVFAHFTEELRIYGEENYTNITLLT